MNGSIAKYLQRYRQQEPCLIFTPIEGVYEAILIYVHTGIAFTPRK